MAPAGEHAGAAAPAEAEALALADFAAELASAEPPAQVVQLAALPRIWGKIPSGCLFAYRIWDKT